MVAEGAVIIGTYSKVEVLILPVEFAVTRHLTILASCIASHTILIFLGMILPISCDIIVGNTCPYAQAICYGRQILLQGHVGEEGTSVCLAIGTSFGQSHGVIITCPCLITTPETTFGLDWESSGRHGINLAPKIVTAQAWTRSLHQSTIDVCLQRSRIGQVDVQVGTDATLGILILGRITRILLWMSNETEIADEIHIGIIAKTLATTTESQVINVTGTIILEGLAYPIYIRIEVWIASILKIT